MPKTTPALQITLDRARARWHEAQGLGEPKPGSLDEIVASTGFLRTLGGVDVYLAMAARAPKLRQRDLDDAVARSALQVVPAMRGCIYLVPRAFAPLCLRVAEELSEARSARELEKAEVKPGEIEKAAEAIARVLEAGPKTTDAIRKALPEGAVRSLGEKGKKIGLSSTLPPALRRLEFDGRVERTLEGGRLDSERYLWRRAAKNPFDGAAVPAEPAARHAELLRLFLRQAGPATLAEFAAWSGLSQRAAREALSRVPTASVAIEGYDGDALVLEGDIAALREAPRPSSRFTMLPFEDNFVALRSGPRLLVEPRHHAREVPVWGQTKGSTLGDAKHMSLRALVADGKIVGVWEIDPDAGKIVIGTFERLKKDEAKSVAALADEVASLLLGDLGHAKSFSLDTVDSIRERAAVVRSW